MNHNMTIKERVRYIFLSLFSLLFAISALGQQNINSTVEVKREFEGKLMEIVKSPLNTKFSDTLLKFNLNFDYYAFDRPYKDLYEFSHTNSIEIGGVGKVKYPVLYAKIAMAFPWLPQADIYIQPRTGEKFSLMFYYNHDSFWGKVGSDYTIRGDRMTNRAGFKSGYSWKKGELIFGFDYNNNYYTYYGGHYTMISPSQILSHTYDDMSAKILLRSTNNNKNAFYYNINLNYNYLKDNNQYLILPSLTEHLIDVNGEIGAAFKEEHKVLIGFKSVTGIYTQNSNSSIGDYQVTPMYRWDGERWNIKAGVTFAGNYPIASKLPVFPDVSATFEAVKTKLWLSLKLDGYNETNFFTKLFKYNPWLSTGSEMHTTSSPFRGEFSVRGVVKDRFSYNVSASYATINNMVTFGADINNNYQNLYYSNNKVVSAGCELYWNSSDFTGGGEFKYHYYFDDTNLYMLPSFEAKLFGIYNLRKRFFIELNCYYRGAVNGYSQISQNSSVRIAPFVDLGLKFTYSFNSKFSLFIDGKNLINNDIQYVQYYLQPGINIGAGIYLKL